MRRSAAPDVPQPLRRWWVAVLVYVAAGLAWILFSDLLLFEVEGDPRWWSVAKGSAYVLLTAGVASLVLLLVQRRLAATLNELATREAELTLLGANARDLLFRYELVPEPRFAFVSDAADHLIGYTPQGHYDDPELGRKLVHPDDQHVLDDPSALTGVLRYRWLHRDGHVVWCEQQNQLQLVDGQAVGIIGVARDVTDEVLRVGVSEAVAQLSRDALVDEAGFEPAVRRLLETVQDRFEATGCIVEVTRTSDGCPGHRLSVGSPAPAPDQDVLVATVGRASVEVVTSTRTPAAPLLRELLGTVADRVDEVHAAEHRDRELRHLRQALQSSASAVLVTDRAGRIEWVNRAFTEVTGYAVAEALGQTPRLLKSGTQDASFYAQLWDTIAAGGSFAGRLVDRRKDGATYTAEVTIDPVMDRAGRILGFVGVQKDVSAEEAERERVRRVEAEALERRAAIERDRSLLVQTISHELRTPLTIVLGAAETLTARPVEPDQRAALLAALTGARAQVLGRLEILLAAADGMEGPPTQVGARALVEAALEALGARHDLSRAAIEGDATWNGQHLLAKALLVPLLDNGFTYSPAHTPVRIDVGSDDGGLRIAIVDEGPGIPDEVLDRLDQPFQQGDPGSTRVHGGFGLGLYAARRVAERLGGTVGFDRVDGSTEVVVRLPHDREVVG
jgi:PAS domain S-box-containing protein